MYTFKFIDINITSFLISFENVLIYDFFLTNHLKYLKSLNV